MESMLGLVVVVVIVWIAVANLGKNLHRPPPRRSIKRLPPKIRPNVRQARRFNSSTPQSDSISDRTTPAGRSSASAGKRVTSGTEHDPPPPIPSSHKLIGRAWVIDGDTIAINRIKIRLSGIDAPELDQPWGRKSKWKMVEICKGKTIHVELTGETSYDRLVGTCFLPDGTDIGAEIIKAGLALDGGYYSKGKYLHLEPEGVRQRLKFYGLRQGK